MKYEEVIKVFNSSGGELIGLLGFESEVKGGVPTAEYLAETENSSIDGLAEFLREEKNLSVEVVDDGFIRL